MRKEEKLKDNLKLKKANTEKNKSPKHKKNTKMAIK